MSYKLICMGFDGEYQTERPDFEDIDAAWEYSNDLGSKWYFYPFHFVTTKSGKTIVDAPYPFGHAEGRRTASIVKIFDDYSKTEEAKDMNVEEFTLSVPI